jgi:7SK snRNA methylphosphate capping enzyme
MVTTTAPEDAVQPPSAAQGGKGDAKRKPSDAPGRGGGGRGGRGGGDGGQGKRRKSKEVFIYGNYKNYYGYRVSSTAPRPSPFLRASKKKRRIFAAFCMSWGRLVK